MLFVALFAVRQALRARLKVPLDSLFPQDNPAIHLRGPVGFPSSGYPDFGFTLKAGCRHVPASHLLLF